MDNEFLAINPIDKQEDILEMLKDYQVEIHTVADKDYDYLDKDTLCIVVRNKQSGDNIEIYLENQGEFTFCFAGCHCHYSPYEDEYEEMKTEVQNILNGTTCAASMYYGSESKWLGSTFLDLGAINEPIKKNFDFVLRHKEFKERLYGSGGIVRYVFWNSDNNKKITIEKFRKV